MIKNTFEVGLGSQIHFYAPKLDTKKLILGGFLERALSVR
jgi:hypothetical protein